MNNCSQSFNITVFKSFLQHNNLSFQTQISNSLQVFLSDILYEILPNVHYLNFICFWKEEPVSLSQCLCLSWNHRRLSNTQSLERKCLPLVILTNVRLWSDFQSSDIGVLIQHVDVEVGWDTEQRFTLPRRTWSICHG